MTTTTATPTIVSAPAARQRAVATRTMTAFATLVRRRLALTARTPREIFVPLTTPVLFALVIAPALDSIGPRVPGLDYMTFAALGTAGLLIPLNCMFAGVGVIVDRASGARRDMLAAPIARPVVVLANLAVALAITSLQIGVLLAAAVLRGADLTVSLTGAGWFLAAAVLLGVGMYGVAEILANRIAAVEEYIGVVPAIAIAPFFFAGSLFPISALPRALSGFARALPLTHAIALIRYGLLGHNGSGLREIWGMSSPTAMAALSLGVLVVFATALTALSIRVFTREAVR